MADYDTKSKVKEIILPEDSWEESAPTTTVTAEGNPISPEELEQITAPDANVATPKNVKTSNSGLKNADINFNQYWDDSSAPNQATAWGMYEKNEGEGVKTSNVEYNPNADINNLDYKYWMEGQYANSDSAWYLARRNDEIASALFNANLTSKWDIIQYLANQPWWNNSSEADRVNTIESIWKRLGQMVAENTQGDDEQAEWDNSPDMSGVNQMESDLMKDTSGTIYWKTWADQDGRVKTLEDENSVYKDIAASRINKLKNLAAMSDASIAASIYSNSFFDEQTLRDFQQYYPTRYALIQEELKRLRWQDTINAITNWTTDYGTGIDTSSLSTWLTSYAVNNATNSTTATQLLKSINSILESNSEANSAKALMQSIENDMATLKNRLSNLKKEANQIFRWDTPQYIVNAYVNNRTQEIQNQMSILEDRYNAAYSRYQDEVQQAQREKEYDLKKEELQLKKDAAALNDYATRENIAIDWYKAKWTTSWTNYTVAERNNNPTNMTVDFMEIVGAELWVDYEISSDSFINSNWKTQYYAKLIWDPVETTIKILDKAIANGVNPFTTTSWSYIEKLWLTKDKWLNMSDEEKQEMVKKWVAYEWGDMANMAYYVSQADRIKNTEFTKEEITAFRNLLNGSLNKTAVEAMARKYWFGDNKTQDLEWLTNFARNVLKEYDSTRTNDEGVSYDVDNAALYTKYLSGDYSPAWLSTTSASVWQSEEEFGNSARAYQKDLQAWLINPVEEWAVLSEYGYSLLKMFAELYNLIWNDKWELDFNFWWFWQTYPYDKWNQIKSELTLEKMIDARSNDIGFWQVTEWEWEMLRKASTAIWSAFWTKDKNINKEVQPILAALWHATYWEDVDISPDEWKKFIANIKAESEWLTGSGTTMIDPGSDLDVFDTDTNVTSTGDSAGSKYSVDEIMWG